MTMMSLVEVVDEDDETKTGHHQNEVWGEEGQTGPIQKRKGPSKIIVIQLVLQLDHQRSLFKNLSFLHFPPGDQGEERRHKEDRVCGRESDQ